MKYQSGQYKIIRQYLAEIDDWVLEGKIRSLQTPYGFVGFRGDRNCRDLVRAGILEKRLVNGLCEVRIKKQILPRVQEILNLLPEEKSKEKMLF